MSTLDHAARLEQVARAQLSIVLGHRAPAYSLRIRTHLDRDGRQLMLGITSLVDEITIQTVTINRGNCTFWVAATRPRLRLGQTLDGHITTDNCEPIEVEVTTDQGVWVYTFN